MQHGNAPYYTHGEHVPGCHPQSIVNMQHGNALYYTGSNLQFQRARDSVQIIPPINPPAYGMRDGRNYFIGYQNHVNPPNRQLNKMPTPHQHRKHNHLNSHKNAGRKGNSQTSTNTMPASYIDVNLTNVTDVSSHGTQCHDPIVNIKRADIQLAQLSDVINVEQYHDDGAPTAQGTGGIREEIISYISSPPGSPEIVNCQADQGQGVGGLSKSVDSITPNRYARTDRMGNHANKRKTPDKENVSAAGKEHHHFLFIPHTQIKPPDSMNNELPTLSSGRQSV